MKIFTHQVTAEDRETSVWLPDGGCFRTPAGRFWHYTSDPDREGVEWKDEHGAPVAIAVWLD